MSSKYKTPLVSLVQKYFESSPDQAAHALETMDEEQAAEVLRSIPISMAAQAVSHLEDVFAAAILQKTAPALFKEIIEKLDSQKGAGIFLHLPKDRRQSFLDHLEEKKKKQIQEILTYPADSAGCIMSLDFVAFHHDLKVKDAISKIRLIAQKKGDPSSYIYVIDRENRLTGIMNMRDMMLALPDTTLDTVMRKEVFSVNCFDDREKVAHELSARHFFAAPVVDQENRLLGVVNTDALIEDVQEEATEDFQKMFGAGGDERVFTPVRISLMKRLPWLYVNLITAFIAASVVSLFQDVIARITILAVYLPVVAGQGGNAGAQSLAVVMRGLVMREIPQSKVKRLVLKEMTIGIVTGFAVGLITALIAWFWHGNPFLGLVIGLAMVVNLAVAGFSGAAIPLTMKAIGLDPAQCSNIILTTITDVMGFFTFLGFAVLFQQYLL